MNNVTTVAGDMIIENDLLINNKDTNNGIALKSFCSDTVNAINTLEAGKSDIGHTHS